jgi:hypothetical protein
VAVVVAVVGVEEVVVVVVASKTVQIRLSKRSITCLLYIIEGGKVRPI